MKLTVVVDASAPDTRREQAHQLEAADQALRQSFSGFGVADVLPEVRQSLDEIGLDLPDETVLEYAGAISERADHVIELR